MFSFVLFILMLIHLGGLDGQIIRAKKLEEIAAK